MKRQNVKTSKRPHRVRRSSQMRRRLRLRAALWCSLALLLCSNFAFANDIVERRGGQPALEGEVLQIDDAGARIRLNTGASQFVPWDRVRHIRMERSDPSLEDRLKTAAELWRARSRLERGDWMLSESLFERHFERTRGSTHETALVVAEGLLRCRLARSAPAMALIPALEVARLRRAGVTTESYRALPAVFDETTALCPLIAPAWMDSATTRRLERELASYDAHGDEVVAAIAELYRRSIRDQIGAADALDEAPFTPRGATARHPGVARLHALVQTFASDAAARDVARVHLSAQLGEMEDWMEAWARFALGSSLLREGDRERQVRGAVNLLHVPARFAELQPYLAGLALALAAEALGEAETASLRTELARRYAHHPVQSLEHRLPEGAWGPRRPEEGGDDAPEEDLN